MFSLAERAIDSHVFLHSSNNVSLSQADKPKTMAILAARFVVCCCEVSGAPYSLWGPTGDMLKHFRMDSGSSDPHPMELFNHCYMLAVDIHDHPADSSDVGVLWV